MSDNSHTPACPDAATLRALLDGTLPDDQQAATQAHVDRCPTCEVALRQMTTGGESWIGMAEKLKTGRADDPNLAAALDRLKADDSSGSEPNEPADPQRTLDFLQPADDPKLLGKLGRHEISEVVGWGGMGVVLKAYDPSLHRVVAVKVLASHLAHHAVARKRFIREAQAAAAVCHDNVVTIHAIEDGVGSLFQAAFTNSDNSAGDGRPEKDSRPLHATLPKIIMQFVAGGSLQERIDQEAPLELKEILRIAMQTAAGLAAAHAQGVVHRDVKPANILLENGVQRVKLTDFGLARVMDDASLTLSGVIAGTPQYMAPEQAWGRDVDARADLFSLGAVMYAMCSGHSPFRARTTMAVLKRVCEDAPRPLRAINPDVPEWLVAIIEKLLAKNPDDRFQTATQVSDLLGRWLAHAQQPTVAPAPPRIHGSSRRRTFQSQAAAETITVSDSVDPGAVPSLSNKESVFLALSMVGACIPFAGLVMFHFASFPPSAPPLDPGIRYLILSMFWGQFLTLVATTAINLRRKSLEVIPTVMLCVALCLTIYFIPVAIMGFRLLGKRMKSDSSIDENSARRESPDPTASPDRKSPKFSRDADDKGGLRSNLSAGPGDPRTAQLSALWGLLLVPVVILLHAVVIWWEWSTALYFNLKGDVAATLVGIQMLLGFVQFALFRWAWNSATPVAFSVSMSVLTLIGGASAVVARSYLNMPDDNSMVLRWGLGFQILSAVAYLSVLFSHARRRSHDFSGEANGEVSNLLDKATTRGTLSFTQTHWPVLGTVVLLAVVLVMMVEESGTRDLAPFLGFSGVHLAVTFALCSGFYWAWNKASWFVWIGLILLLPTAEIVLWLSAGHKPLAPKLLAGWQLVLAFAFQFGLMFVRPLFVRNSGKWMSERLSGWQQLFAIACFTIVGTPVMFLLMYWLSYSARPVPIDPPTAGSTQVLVVPTDELNKSNRRPNGFPKPMLLVGEKNIEPDAPALPGVTAKGATIPESLKALLGRWVVVSSEGAELGSAGMPLAGSDSNVAPMGGASPLAGASGGGPSAGGMMGMSGAAAIFPGPPVHWIEFAADHVLVFDGRQAKLKVEFSEDVEPKRFSLSDAKSPAPDAATDWRHGIFRLERDRLILCWTNQHNYVPSEFAGTGRSELLVLRREWQLPPDSFAIPGNTPAPPPRAVIPFTFEEGKRFQKAWAHGSLNVPIEATNSLGMAMNLIPAGAFDDFQQRMLDGNLFGKPVCHPAVARPMYFGKQEVTVAQFRKFVEATGYQTSAERVAKPESLNWRNPGIVQDSDEHPVVHVSWEDAQAFCRWLSETTQEPYRLPTLAEWAFAARAGLGVNSSMKPAANARLKFFDTTAPVGKDTANLFGLHDLFGNVAEWTNQLTEPDDLWLAAGGGFRSSMTGEGTGLKGRSVQHVDAWLMARRAGDSETFDDVGFRVVRVIGEDAVDFSGSLPQVQALVTKSTRIQCKDFDGPVVLVRGLFPASAVPQPFECVDFEIERTQADPSKLGDGFPTFNRNWQKIDLDSTRKFLERSESTSDLLPALLTNNVFTMPLPLTSLPFPKNWATHPQLPLVPPKSKYEARYQLFRFIDFEAAPGRAYAYRVRLKFAPPSKQEPPRTLFNNWSSESEWVEVEKPPSN